MTRRTAIQLFGTPLALRSIGTAASRPYRLGCQTLPYQNQPLPRAIEGIRKAGYRYVQVYHMHAGRLVFAPETPRAELLDLRQRLTDAGLEMFCGFVGLRGDLRKGENFTLYLKELDLAREFGVRTVVDVGFGHYTDIPAAFQHAVRHAASIGVTIAVKPRAGLVLTQRPALDNLKICWDAGNVSFHDGVHPDLAPRVTAVCVKAQCEPRANPDLPVPVDGPIDYERMFRDLFRAGFEGPISVERIDGTGNVVEMAAELVDARLRAARAGLVTLLDRIARV